MNWRDIPARTINWRACGASSSPKARNVLWYLSRVDGKPGAWSEMTLGEIADLGERSWLRVTDVGSVTVSIIKATIDMAAESPASVTSQTPSAPYIPKCERSSE